MEETQLHECSVRESDPMTSQYRCGGNIRIYPWYLILDTHSPYIYIYTRIFTFFIFIYTYIYILFKYTYSIVYLQYYCLNTHAHIWVDWCRLHVFCSKSPKMVKHWVKFALEALQSSGDRSCNFAASGRGGWYWLCGELLRVAQRPLESTINQKTHSQLHSRKRT